MKPSPVGLARPSNKAPSEARPLLSASRFGPAKESLGLGSIAYAEALGIYSFGFEG